jgi:iron complex transport system ATP-binding protein
MKKLEIESVESAAAKKIELENVEIYTKKILRNINITLHAGEFVGLIGPNGAGKTTLLKSLNGLIKTDGTVRIDGKDITKMKHRDIALLVSMMHQETSIDFPFSAYDVVMTGRYAHQKRLENESQKDHEIVQSCMKKTDIWHLANQPITQMSGGERQRVFFAKALAQETDVILLDEPAASLDMAHEEVIFNIAQGLCRSGRTIVVAVHDLRVAAKYCSRLILMKRGEILADGTPEEVLTSDNLNSAYHVNSLVYKNRMTGMLDIWLHGRNSKRSLDLQKKDQADYLYEKRDELDEVDELELNEKHKNQEKIHIIGGGGSATAVMRYLYEHGYEMTTGVLFEGDSDLHCAQILGIPAITGVAFVEICESDLQKNKEWIMDADTVVLCNMPFGPQNLSNLENSIFAKKLVIIENESVESRDFTEGRASELYKNVSEKAIIIKESLLHEVFEPL